MPDYYLNNTPRDFPGFALTTEASLVAPTPTGGATSVVLSAGATTGLTMVAGWTIPIPARQAIGTSAMAGYVSVTSIGSSTTLRVAAGRIRADGVNISAFVGTATAGTGIHSSGIGGQSQARTTLVNELGFIRLEIANSNMMSAESATISTNNIDSRLVMPWVPVTLVPLAPGAPAFDLVGQTSVRITFVDTTSPAERRPFTFEIWRSDGGVAQLVTTLDASEGTFNSSLSAFTLQYTDAGLVGGTSYTYFARAVNPNGTTDSPSAVVTTAAPSPVTAAPTVTATPVSGSQINLSWGAVEFAGSYEVERNNVSIVTGNVPTSYSDTGLSVGSTHSYRVRAVNSVSTGPWSSAVSATTITPPQISTPSADGTTVGVWVGQPGNITSNLYTAIDEASPGSTSDYIESPVGAATTDFYRTVLSSVNPPSGSRANNHILRVRHGKSATGGQTCSVALSIRQGSGALIATRNIDSATMESLDRTEAITLTEAEANLITDYSDLRLEFNPTFGGGQKRTYDIFWAEFEVPYGLPPVPPEAPTNLAATGTLGGVSLSWNAPVSGPNPSSYRVMRDKIQHLTGDNSTFTSGLGGWTAEGATISNVTGSIEVLATNATSEAISPAIPARVGVTYSISGKVRTLTGSSQVRLRVQGYSASGDPVGNMGSSTGTFPTSTFEEKTLSYTPAAGIHHFKVRLSHLFGGNGDTSQWDDIFVSGLGVLATGVAANSYNDNTAIAEVPYQYTVRSVSLGLESTDSNAATGTRLPPGPMGTFATKVMALGPRSYWRLNESMGAATAADETGLSPGTYRNDAILGTASPLMVDGTTGMRVEVRQRVDFPHEAGHNISFRQPLSFSFLYRPFGGGTAGFPTVIVKGPDGTDGWSIWRRQNYTAGETSGQLKIANAGATMPVDYLVFGEWHHYVMTMSASQVKWFRGGVLIGTSDITGTAFDNKTATNTTTLDIGHLSAATGNTSIGEIDEFAWFDKTLTDTEAQELYQSLSGAPPATPQFAAFGIPL